MPSPCIISPQHSAAGCTHFQLDQRLAQVANMLCVGGENDAMAAFEVAFRRGKRFKKLAKMLSGRRATQPFRHFALHTWVLLSILQAVHLGCFITMVVLLDNQVHSPCLAMCESLRKLCCC